MSWEDHPDVLVFTREMITTRHCRHRSVVVDKHARRVWCRNCEADLDPIEVIDRYACEHFNLREKMESRRPEHWEKIESFVEAGGSLSIYSDKVVATMKVGGKKKTSRGTGTSLAARVKSAIMAWQWRLVKKKDGSS